MYVVSAFKVKVPLTVNEPESFALSHAFGSRPAQFGSTDPLTVRHEDFTVQTPTTLPAQAVPFGQEAPPPVPPLPLLPPDPTAPPVPLLPPDPLVPPLPCFPPDPGLGVPVLEVQELEATATASARTAN